MPGMNINAETKVFGLLGSPIAHSLSPTLYNQLFAQLELNAVYVPFEVLASRAAEAIAELVSLGISGANLTLPCKGHVGVFDQLSPAAAASGAVNVAVVQGGRLLGFNTDGEGFVRALVERCSRGPDGAKVAIFGAGGAARAVAQAVAEHGCETVSLLNRTQEHAQLACERLAQAYPRVCFEAVALELDAVTKATARADLVVNALPEVASGWVDDLSMEHLQQHTIWCDLNYWMSEPPAASRCGQRGIQFVGGLGMFAQQAAMSFELFTGHNIAPTRILTLLR